MQKVFILKNLKMIVFYKKGITMIYTREHVKRLLYYFRRALTLNIYKNYKETSKLWNEIMVKEYELRYDIVKHEPLLDHQLRKVVQKYLVSEKKKFTNILH